MITLRIFKSSRWKDKISKRDVFLYCRRDIIGKIKGKVKTFIIMILTTTGVLISYFFYFSEYS